jgi:hypothetical protein
MSPYNSINLSGSDYNALMDDLNEREAVGQALLLRYARTEPNPEKVLREWRRKHHWLEADGDKGAKR